MNHFDILLIQLQYFKIMHYSIMIYPDVKSKDLFCIYVFTVNTKLTWWFENIMGSRSL